MGLTLLAPLFLAGLAAVAIPVIIHLVHRQKATGTPFPSLMFLRKIPHKAQRRQKIRHWFLFLLRCLALILLALAFARPLLHRAGEATGLLAGGRDLVILVDRSYSMGYDGRWEEAIASARRVIDGLGPEDRAALVMFDQEARAVSQPTSDPIALRAALDAQELGAGMTRFNPALKIAAQMLGSSELPQREIVLISDFQRSGRNLEDEMNLPSGVRLTVVDLSPANPSNVAVASVGLAQRIRDGRERATISGRVVNLGSDDAQGVGVDLVINDQTLESQTVDVAAGGSESVVFGPMLVPSTLSRGTVRIGDDALARDNAFHFVLTPGRAVSVLIVEGPGPRENQSLFLTRALSVGDRPPFETTVVSGRSLRVADLDDRAVVVLNEVGMPSGGVGERLRRFVNEGGGLFVILGDRGAAGWGGGDGLLPGVVGDRVERSETRGGTVTDLDFGHPVLEVFNAPRSGDFASANVFRYRRLGEVDHDAVLARFDDGAVALAERRVGAGRVIAWTSTIDTYWNNVALQPVFLPFIHETAKYLAGHTEVPPFVTIGDVVDLRQYAEALTSGVAVVQALEDGQEVIVEAPDGDRRRIADGEDLLDISAQGFYEISVPRGTERPLLLASNVDPMEADLASLDVEEFVSTVAAEPPGAEGSLAAETLTPAQQEQRQRLWWYLLMATLLILAFETAISNRLSRAVR